MILILVQSGRRRMLRRPCDDNDRMCPSAPHYAEVSTDEDDGGSSTEDSNTIESNRTDRTLIYRLNRIELN